MKVLLLSRPVINAGDFLFTEKSLEAMKRICPNAEITTGHIANEYTEKYANSFDSIVAAGGPLYDSRFLTADAFPILGFIKNLRPQVYFLSNGWYGSDTLAENVYSYKLDNVVLETLKLVETHGGGYSCRDDVTAMVLRNNGFRNVSMVGCTAWYDYENINVTIPKYRGKIENILISDQGITKDANTWDWKFKSAERLIETVKHVFPSAKLIYTFNGGIDTKYSGKYNHRICELLDRAGIPYKDISGSSSGFNLCENADLHIGFRMHTHIYCMSKRIPSVLIGEDARGAGLNQTLGAPDILDYSFCEGKKKENDYLPKQLEYYLEELLKTDFLLLSGSYIKMKAIYEKSFVPFVKGICNDN